MGSYITYVYVYQSFKNFAVFGSLITKKNICQVFDVHMVCLSIGHNVPRVTRGLGIGEQIVLAQTNVTRKAECFNLAQCPNLEYALLAVAVFFNYIQDCIQIHLHLLLLLLSISLPILELGTNFFLN